MTRAYSIDQLRVIVTACEYLYATAGDTEAGMALTALHRARDRLSHAISLAKAGVK